jgi:DNA-binding NarL/FixJ family response regulator
VEILAMLGRGASNQEIAGTLVISPKTVDHHVSAVLRKLGVDNRRAAGRAATELGIGLGGPAKDRESAARIAD